MQNLVEMLNEGMVEFTFRKKNGEVRNMFGTRNMSYVPDEMKPKGGMNSKSEHIVTVFDLENMSWRSFDIDSVLEVF